MTNAERDTSEREIEIERETSETRSERERKRETSERERERGTLSDYTTLPLPSDERAHTFRRQTHILQCLFLDVVSERSD